MADDKILVINIRKEALKTPKQKRSESVAMILKRKVAQLAKGKSVKLDAKTNELIWSRGRKNPKMTMRLKLKKLDDGTVETELVS